MTSRERMLTALSNGRPDRLPCQVHSWMGYYLEKFLGGIDQWAAFEMFDLDFAIYLTPTYVYDERSLANWKVDYVVDEVDSSGNKPWMQTVTTPKGTLHSRGASNDMTGWVIEPLIRNERDFALWDEFLPMPTGVDFSEMHQFKERIGERGILRTFGFSPGQGSPWQSFACLYDVQPAIMLGMDEPETLHHYLDCILQKTLKVAQMWEGIPADVIEVGGGAGSNTVISPAFYREFGLSYDQQQNKLYHQVGLKIVNHFCGGVMKMLDLVVESGADGLETMTPPAMGGDCDLAEASRNVGDKLFFIGGFDQNSGFTTTPETARKLVFECFEATRDHAGYICCPSDHFFDGDPENIHAFARACHECVY